MSEWIFIPIFLVMILVLIGIGLTLVYWKKKKKDMIKETNYQVFFTLGVVWLPIGVVFMITINHVIGIAFLTIGITYLAIGLANRDK
jgi:hypothetical protein